MKQIVFIVFLLNSIWGCEPEKSEARLSGSWYTCAKNGGYIEMHIRNGKYKYSTDFCRPTHWNEFEIKGDTLIQYDKFIYADSIVVNKAQLHFPNTNEFQLEYLTSDENWTFYRLDGEIENIENNSALQKATLERSKTRKCNDNRTDEEKQEDSLRMDINFQF